MEVGDIFLPVEVVLLILDHLSNMSDLHKFSKISRSFRSMLLQVQVLRPSHDQGLGLGFLRLFENVAVQGRVVAHCDDMRRVGVSRYNKDLEAEVWALSKCVSGDFSLYLSAHRGVCPQGRRVSNLQPDSENLDSLLDLMFRLLIARVLEFPESSVRLVIKEGCEISWTKSRCTLHIPVSYGNRRPSERVGRLVKKLFQTIPISHIAYQGTTICPSTHNLIPFSSKSCRERDYNVVQVIFGSAYPRVLPLTSIGVTTDSSLFHNDSKLWDRKVMKGVQHIEFLKGGYWKIMEACLRALPYNARKSILSITGECYLDAYLNINGITALISDFNPCIVWKILVHTWRDVPTMRPRRVTLEQLEQEIQVSKYNHFFRQMCIDYPLNHFEFYLQTPETTLEIP